MFYQRDRSLAFLCIALVGATIVAFLPTPAEPKTNLPDGSFNVTVSINASCSVIATDMVLASTAGSNSEGTSTVTVNCDNGAPYNIGLGVGTLTGTVAAVQTPGSGAITGLALSISNTVSGLGSGGSQKIIVRGQLPAPVSGKPDRSAESVTVTVSY